MIDDGRAHQITHLHSACGNDEIIGPYPWELSYSSNSGAATSLQFFGTAKSARNDKIKAKLDASWKWQGFISAKSSQINFLYCLSLMSFATILILTEKYGKRILYRFVRLRHGNLCCQKLSRSLVGSFGKTIRARTLSGHSESLFKASLMSLLATQTISMVEIIKGYKNE